jgi:hypothetical protein
MVMRSGRVIDSEPVELSSHRAGADLHTVIAHPSATGLVTETANHLHVPVHEPDRLAVALITETDKFKITLGGIQRMCIDHNVANWRHHGSPRISQLKHCEQHAWQISAS